MNQLSLEDRFCQLLEEHGRVVLKIANTYAFEIEDRRDLVQEIHAQLWKAFPAYDATRPFSTWLYRIALNVAVSHVRTEAARHRKSVSLDEQVAENIAISTNDNENNDQLDFLQRFIESQGPLDKALLLLYLEERSYIQISEILGISETNVATKIGRLKQRAKALVAKEEKEMSESNGTR